jgi:Flp pilus assembly pilin Flp
MSLNRFRLRNLTRTSTLINDERGLSTVEYVIILVLIAAAAVGVWSTLGTTLKTKIGAANSEIEVKVKIESTGDGDSSGTKDPL